MTILQLVREVQIPVVAVLLLAGCAAKVLHAVRAGSLDIGLGPTALYPVSMRTPLAVTMCLVEALLGLGLLVTAGKTIATGGSATATIARLGAGLLFLVATSALIELRTVRPDVGCGCFGDFSTAPVSGRTIARSAFLAVAILSTIGLPAVSAPRTSRAGLELLVIVCAELLLIVSLSPEVGPSLVRLGYSEPCEVRDVPSARTLVALRRSKQWRRYAVMLDSDVPADIWRELCWRYVVYPSNYAERPADLVFAVFLQYRRPVVHAALVDSSTGLPLPWPDSIRGASKTAAPALEVAHATDEPADAIAALALQPGIAAGTNRVTADLPFSS